jgi:hypothetical protein
MADSRRWIIIQTYSITVGNRKLEEGKSVANANESHREQQYLHLCLLRTVAEYALLSSPKQNVSTY